MSSGVLPVNVPLPPPSGDPLLDFLVAPPVTGAIITASVALLVGVIAAVVTPAATSLRARRQAIHDKFDVALAALLLVQAARWTPTGMRETRGGRSADEQRALNLRMDEKSLDFFIDKTADAKVALVALEQYVPEIRARLTSNWELTEEDEPMLRAAIEQRRPGSVKAERLFRQRGPLAQTVQPAPDAAAS